MMLATSNIATSMSSLRLLGPDSVVDFVRPGVQKIFAFEGDPRSAEFCGESRSELQRRGAPGEILEQLIKFGLERCVRLGLLVGAFEFVKWDHQRLRDVATAVRAETAGNVRANDRFCGHGLREILYRAFGVRRRRSPFARPLRGTQEISRDARETSSKKACSFAGSFLPGRDSTPLATSTAKGRTMRMASATFSGVRPPARMTRCDCATARARCQLPVVPLPPYWPESAESRRKAEALRK